MSRLRQTGQADCFVMAKQKRARSDRDAVCQPEAERGLLVQPRAARVLQPQVVRGQDDRDIAGEVAAGAILDCDPATFEG